MKDKTLSHCVVIPTYNNRSTIQNTITELLPLVEKVIVVNDGSTDGTEEILRELPSIELVNHEKNLGKGAALAHGLARAFELGFSHAVTFDADGQHKAADLPKFKEAVEKNPEALIIGVRDLVQGGEKRRLKSRILRVNSNFWAWLLTGVKTRDSQSGFRAYPLKKIHPLKTDTEKYDYEIEVLVKALWTDVPLVTVPIEVSYGPGSGSHFRPLRDFLLVAHLNIKLIFQALFIPAPLRRVIHIKGYEEFSGRWRIFKLLQGTFREEFSSAGALALSIGIGVFCGIIPIWGFQMVCAYLIAHKLGLSRLVCVAASNISFPAATPFILYASVILGGFLLKGSINYSLDLTEISQKALGNLFLEYLVGSLALALIAGVVATLISYLITRAVMSFTQKNI